MCELLLLTDDEGGLVDPSLTRTAVDIVGQVASDARGREALLDGGAGRAKMLLGLLSSDAEPALIESTLAAFAALAADPAGCAFLRGVTSDAEEPPASGEGAADEEADAADSLAAAPLTQLPELLRHDEPSVRRAAAGLVAAAASDRANTEMIISLGAPTLLVAASAGGEGGGAAAAKTAVQALCHSSSPLNLWLNGCLPMSASIADGFYAVPQGGAFAPVDRVGQGVHTTDLLLVDATADPDFARVAQQAAEMAAASQGGRPSDLAAEIAKLVAGRLGGPVSYDRYEQFDTTAELGRLKEALGTPLLPIGKLGVGAARHRAILFKALADRAGLVSALQMGRALRGAHAHHAWNVVVVDGGLAVVDLLHEVGSFYPEGSDGARRYMRVDEFAFSSLGSLNHALTAAVRVM